MDYFSPRVTFPPKLHATTRSCRPDTELTRQSLNRPLVETWITELRPLPELYLFPEELILALASWCLDPQTLLNLSSTCKRFARILRTVDVWLDHHWGRGYDIGILKNKVERAASAPEQKYGPGGWGLLVKSAFDKAEFPDDEYMTQWRMGKPTPHLDIQDARGLNIPDAIEKYQPRGEQWMRVMYDVLTEHECHNLELYPYLNDEALKVRVKSIRGRYFQALISASELLIRMWALPIAAMTTTHSVVNTEQSMKELGEFDYERSSLPSLTYSFLCANKLMQIIPEAQTQRKLYPHPPFGADIWLNARGDIDPKGLAWIQRVRETWKGRVYVMGQYAKITSSTCPFATPRLNRSPMRMCLDFHPDGQITGRGGDFGGRFFISGSYKSTFVKLEKRYEEEEEEDVYLACGHMTPWGVYGRWTVPDEPDETLGYWCMWHFEGAPVFPLSVPFETPNGQVYLKQEPYKVNPNWFIEYEQARDSGKHVDRMHGWFVDPPPEPEMVPLPEPDVWGL